MNLAFTAEQEAFRMRLRRWLAENLPAGWGTDAFPAFGSDEEEVTFLRDWQIKLHRGGWCGLTWAPEYGGRGATLVELAIFNEEMARVQAPEMINRVGINGAHVSVKKAFRTHLTQHLHETALALQGPAAILMRGDPRAMDHGRWQQTFLWSRCAGIAGRTSEIQLNIIATQVLGLPKSS